MQKWLTGAAVWIVIVAMIAIACFGHIVTLGLLAIPAVLITIGIEVYAARGAVHIGAAPHAGKRIALGALIVLCLAVSFVFEHRGIEALNSWTNRDYNLAASERARALETKDRLEAMQLGLPVLPTDPAALDAMDTRSLNRIERAREEWCSRYCDELDAASAASLRPLPERFAAPLETSAIDLIVWFVLAFKLLGLWAIAPGSALVVSWPGASGRRDDPTPEAALTKTPAPAPSSASEAGRALRAKRTEKAERVRQMLAAQARQAEPVHASG